MVEALNAHNAIREFSGTVKRQPVMQKQVGQLGIDLNDRGISSPLSSLVLFMLLVKVLSVFD